MSGLFSGSWQKNNPLKHAVKFGALGWADPHPKVKDISLNDEGEAC